MVYPQTFVLLCIALSLAKHLIPGQLAGKPMIPGHFTQDPGGSWGDHASTGGICNWAAYLPFPQNSPYVQITRLERESCQRFRSVSLVE